MPDTPSEHTNKLTVLQALPALEIGGVERGTLEVAAALVRRGHRSIVISAGGRLEKKLLAEGSEHITLPIGRKSPFTFRHVAGVRKILAGENISILHARSRLPAWICYLAWKTLPFDTRPLFVTTFHGPYSPGLYSRIMIRGERVIAVSEYIRKYMLRCYPDIDENKISVILRGVSCNEYNQDFRPDRAWLTEWYKQYPHLRDKYIISLPGRISRRKGHEDFIRIIAALESDNINVHGLIIGEPHESNIKYYAQICRRVSDLGLDKHITFLGYRNDVREILSLSNIVLSLSKEPEAFGRTVLETLYLGTPVIAYDIGGTTEIMNEIFPAGIVTHGDTEEVCNKIKMFMDKPPCVSAYYPFTLENMLDSTIRLYEKLAHKQAQDN